MGFNLGPLVKLLSPDPTHYVRTHKPMCWPNPPAFLTNIISYTLMNRILLGKPIIIKKKDYLSYSKTISPKEQMYDELS